MDTDGVIAASVTLIHGIIRMAGIILTPGAILMVIILIHTITGIILTGVVGMIIITVTGTGITDISGIIITDKEGHFQPPTAEGTRGPLQKPIPTGRER